MLQPSGPISLLDLKNEFGDTNPVSLGDYYRGGQFVHSAATQVPTSGPLSLSNLYGVSKAFVINHTISSDTLEFNLSSLATSLGWDGIIPINATITVNAGIVVYADDTATPAFTVPANIPNESQIAVINNGYIVGMGGMGGSVGSVNGKPGGPALSVSKPASVTNNGTIGGGGGGGGCFAAWYNIGGGGGRTGRVNSLGGPSNGNPGTFDAAGARKIMKSTYSGAGGNWGAAGESSGNGALGGAGGAAVIGNANVTWLATGTRMGALT